MSRARGIFPLFLATGFGIANGIWAFGPALKEDAENKPLRDSMGVAKEADEAQQEEMKVVVAAEAAASRTAATASTLKSETNSSSWWPKMDFWSGKAGEGSPISSKGPLVADTKLEHTKR